MQVRPQVGAASDGYGVKPSWLLRLHPGSVASKGVLAGALHDSAETRLVLVD